MKRAALAYAIRKGLVWCGVATLLIHTNFAALSLVPGQNWTFEFQQLPFSHVERIGETPDPFFPTPSAGFVQVTVSGEPAFVGRLGLLDVFENSATEPINLGTTLDLAEPASKLFTFGAGDFWQDLQGAIQIRVQSPLNIESLSFRVHVPRDSSSYNVYEATMTVPEPNVLTLAAIGVSILFSLRTLHKPIARPQHRSRCHSIIQKIDSRESPPLRHRALTR